MAIGILRIEKKCCRSSIIIDVIFIQLEKFIKYRGFKLVHWNLGQVKVRFHPVTGHKDPEGE